MLAISPRTQQKEAAREIEMSEANQNESVCETMPGDRGHWMTTYMGRKFYPLDPKSEDMHILDVAHHLSMQCRYNGACQSFYSVAEHCVIGSYLVPPELAFNFLMHDAAETWLGDFIRPIKHGTRIGVLYERMEDKVWDKVGEKWGCHSHPTVKKIDGEMCLVEMRQLFPIFPDKSLLDYSIHPDVKLHLWNPEIAEANFLMRFEELGGRYE